MKTPPAPANRFDLKTWSADQLEYAAPIWVAKLEAWMQEDAQLAAQCPSNSQLLVDALGIIKRRQEQLTYWKLIKEGHKTYRVLPPSLRTFKRIAQPTPLGYVRRNTTVGSWDKAAGIWA